MIKKLWAWIMRPDPIIAAAESLAHDWKERVTFYKLMSQSASMNPDSLRACISTREEDIYELEQFIRVLKGETRILHTLDGGL